MMTVEQHREYVEELYKMLCKIERLHGCLSPQATAMSSIHSAELIAYLGRVNNDD